jgi:hypothetical protein
MKTKKKVTSNISKVNKKNLQILETKLFGKLKLSNKKSALSLLGRD